MEDDMFSIKKEEEKDAGNTQTINHSAICSFDQPGLEQRIKKLHWK